MLKSPYLIGTLAGAAIHIVGIELPPFLLSPILSIKAIATPLCLIALGGTFVFESLAEFKKEIVISVLLKCFILPVFVLLPAVLLGFRGVSLLSLAVLFICPSAASTYSYSVSISSNPQLASQIVVYTTVFSMFSIPCWIFAALELGLA